MISFSSQKAIAQSSLNTLNNQKICDSNLAVEIEKITNTSEQKRAFWGLKIQTLNSNQILYELNAHKYFVPASNVKLLTTAAALLKLGADYRINTPIYISGSPPHLKTLRIIGKGDPTLTDKKLQELARKLKTIGVRRIDQLIVEDGYLPAPEINPTWEWTDLYYYYAVPVNSLILNENTFSLALIPTEINNKLDLEWSNYAAAKQWLINNQTVTAEPNTDYNIRLNLSFQRPVLEFQGELAIDSETDVWWLSTLKPGKYFLDSLRHILARKGIIVSHSNLISPKSSPQDYLKFESETEERIFLTFKSPSLAELIKTTNQDSNNLFAEVLLKYLASNNNQDYITELETILSDLGLEKDNYKLKDGSGLSRQNLATPHGFTELLNLMTQTEHSEIYRQSLAIAGVNGTLKNRFKNTLVEGNLQAKTGTLTGVSALSGYLEIPNYEPLIISIIVNHSPEKSSTLRQVIDEIVILLSQLKKCTP